MEWTVGGREPCEVERCGRVFNGSCVSRAYGPGVACGYWCEVVRKWHSGGVMGRDSDAVSDGLVDELGFVHMNGLWGEMVMLRIPLRAPVET
eukprot:2207707-Amphidinium_carterae.1